MISRSTVFVVGAGAGQPFDFPTGEALIDDLTREAWFPASARSALEEEVEAEFVADQLEQFKARLRDAMPHSIDDFLQHHPGLLKTGKLCIATRLIGNEKHEPLFDRRRSGHWLMQLWNAMRPTQAEQFRENKVSFIIYNYDRCIEHFFTTVMASTFPNLTASAAFEHVSRLEFVHPHGQLAPYWPRDRGMSRGTGARPFEPEIDSSTVNLAADHISLFWENRPEYAETRRAVGRLLRDAFRVVFLGFGFLESNMSHIRPHLSHNGGGNLYGTTKGLAVQERKRLERTVFGGGHFVDCDCLTLLRDVVPLTD